MGSFKKYINVQTIKSGLQLKLFKEYDYGNDLCENFANNC